ncbi:unnamed protein product [Caenorhabditis brenneri]
MSSGEKLISEYDNASTIESSKTNKKTEKEKKPSPTAGKQSEGKKSKKEKPSLTTNTEKPPKSQKSIKSKKPKRELTDSEYERFIEYEDLRKAVKLPPFIPYNSHKRMQFEMEVTPKQLLVNPDKPFQLTVKSMVKETYYGNREKQEVIVEVDSVLFKLLNPSRQFGLKSQFFRVMKFGETLKLGIVLKTPKEMQERLIENKTLNCTTPTDLAGVVRVYHTYDEVEYPELFLATGTRSELLNPDMNAALREYPIRLTKETESVKKLEMLYNVILVEFERREKCERNVFEMKVTPEVSSSIDPDVPYKVIVKSLAKEKQKLIIDLRSFFYKILNAMEQKDYATQIHCTIMPEETMDFKIVLRSEKEAIDCLKGSKYSETTICGRLTITHFKCHLEDKESPHWLPYKPPQQGQEPPKPNSNLLNAEEERLDREHGKSEGFSFISCYKSTEATTRLEKIFNEYTGSKAKEEKKKKKCVIL